MSTNTPRKEADITITSTSWQVRKPADGIHLGACVTITVEGQACTGIITKITSGRMPYKVTLPTGAIWSASRNALQAVTDEAQAEQVLRDVMRARTEGFTTFTLGTVCAVKGKDGDWVVINPLNASGRVKVAKLGGTDNLYLSCTPEQLTKK